MTTSRESSQLTHHSTQAGNIVRAVTDYEVAFFKENGWALLRGLVDSRLCHAMLELGRSRLAGLMNGTRENTACAEENRERLGATRGNEGSLTDIKQWVEWRGAVRDARDPIFSSVALSSSMGHNLKRLLARDKPMRVYHDILSCKLPENVSTPTGWHQDSTNFSADRHAITVWIALDEVRPEQGPVQFYSGSHRCGMLGAIPARDKLDLLDEYPVLTRLPLSPPHHLQPGDCTVHHGLTVHGASANNTAFPRWSYFIAYLPSDARYTGAPSPDTDGFGLKVGYPIDHPSFALVEE